MKSIKYGIVHAYAQCQDCEWDNAIDIKERNRMQNLRNRIRKHIRETGHTVDLETGNITEYSPKNSLEGK